MWVIKLSNGQGFVEWYSSLAVRAQSQDKAGARQYASYHAAREHAQFCQRNADAFSGIYWDSGRPSLIAEVEPVDSHISVWRFKDAPEVLRRLCPQAWLNPDGEHDALEASWLAYVPPGSGWVGWLESKEFTCCEVREHTLADGAQVIIAAHRGWCSASTEADLPDNPDRVIRAWRYGDERVPVSVPATDDADWVAQVPQELVDVPISWMESGSSFGCSGVDQHSLPDGGELRIGCHA